MSLFYIKGNFYIKGCNNALSFIFKTVIVCNFAKREEKCMKQYKNLV